MQRRSYYIINSITVYRLIAAPVLIFLIFAGKTDYFKWLLALSFFTDLIDGYLARKFKVTSIFGSRLDSIADDLTIVAAIVGLFVLKQNFIKEEIKLIAVMLSLFIFQNIIALIKYRKITSFHVWSAKVAAILQGLFLIFIFLLPEPVYSLFYVASAVTIVDLLEEIILVFLLNKWEANVKGLYWVMKRKREE